MAWVIWLVIGVVLIVAEMFTLTFYLLTFGASAFVAFVVAFVFPEAYLLQVVVACIVALVLTVFVKPLTRRLHTSRGFRDAIDDLVGKQGVVVEGIPEEGLGIVRVGNETWSAKADNPLAAGEQVIILNRSSTVVEVQKWEAI
ncbi:MAG: NfeD family protein [Gorillibacterium sp.]|nr:NfeD family protein [Gorillibacterium sp.]